MAVTHSVSRKPTRQFSWAIVSVDKGGVEVLNKMGGENTLFPGVWCESGRSPKKTPEEMAVSKIFTGFALERYLFGAQNVRYATALSKYEHLTEKKRNGAQIALACCAIRTSDYIGGNDTEVVFTRIKPRFLMCRKRDRIAVTAHAGEGWHIISYAAGKDVSGAVRDYLKLCGYSVGFYI